LCLDRTNTSSSILCSRGVKLDRLATMYVCQMGNLQSTSAWSRPQTGNLQSTSARPRPSFRVQHAPVRGVIVFAKGNGSRRVAVRAWHEPVTGQRVAPPWQTTRPLTYKSVGSLIATDPINCCRVFQLPKFKEKVLQPPLGASPSETTTK
jgi:hypothetical protein